MTLAVDTRYDTVCFDRIWCYPEFWPNMTLSRVWYKLDARKRTSIVTLVSVVTQHDTLCSDPTWCLQCSDTMMASSDPTWCYPDLLQILTTPLLLGAELIITHEPARCQHLYTDAHVRTMNDPLGKRSDRGVKHRSDTRWPQPSWVCDINTTRRSSDRRKSEEKKVAKFHQCIFLIKK